MSKELVIAAGPHETRVAIVEDGQLCEIYIEREKEFALVGSLYKGRVTRVLPGMQSAFVDIGLDSDAFLYVSDFLENLEDYDHVPAPVTKVPVSSVAPQAAEPHGASPIPAAVSGTGFEESTAETASPVSEPAPASAAPPAEPSRPSPAAVPPQQAQRPHERRPNRGQGGFGGGEHGQRGRRWGRRGQGGGRNGRDLPSSKYASPGAPEGRHREESPYEPPANYEPIILPGESLAKYKDRVPAAPAAPAEAPAHSSETVPPLPNSLYVTPQSESRVASPEPKTSVPEAHVAGEEFAYAQPLPPIASGSLAGHAGDSIEEPKAAAEVGSPLSDEEMSTLTEQLVEVKHEEAQASATEREDVAEAAVVPFVEEAELEELEDALHAAQIEAHEAEADAAQADAEDEAEAEADAEAEAQEAEAEGGALRGLPEEADDESPVEIAEEQHLEERAVSEAEQHNQAQPTNARVSQPPRARFQRPMRRGGRRRRGGSPHEHRSHAPQRTQPRRPQLISEVLKAGQEIIVQIAKEPLGKKGARITSHVALPGRFLVYMPTVDHIGVSHRIGSSEDRSRLRRVVTEAKGTFPGGFIVRTAAASATDDEIRADVEFLGRTWDTIRTGSEQRRAPALLHRDLNLVERILRDYLSDDYAAIWINNEEEYGKVLEFVGRFQPRLINRVKLYTKDSPIFEEFGIQQELDKALRPKVWLKSGGYIVINHTEALVAIDVNTGKFVGRGSTRLEDTIVRTNLEAVNEIVRQIRLRDLGGIIVVDFIDMEERRNREKVLSALEQALHQDRAPSKALAFNEFGLVCITRKRTKQALERVLCQPCPYCTGSGMVKSVPTICYEIQNEARKMAAELDTRSVTLRVNPEIAKALKTRESLLVDELEQATRKSVIIQSDPTLHWEQYDIY